MPTYQPRPTKVNKRFVPIPQARFPKGYISILTDSRIPPDGLGKMFNITLEQDSIPRPRPPFIPYGQNFLGTCIGIGTFVKWVSGVPTYYEISMQIISGVSTICTRKDGGTWTTVSGTYTYSTTAWCTFTQGAQLTTSDTTDNRVYVSNGVNNMSYYDIGGNNVIQYVGLSTPDAPTTTASSGLSGSNYNQYYRISANNAGGESAASANYAAAISTARDYWVSTTQYITVSWSAVTGATSYNIYTSDQSGQEAYLATVNGTTFVDNGTTSINVFKLAPNNDSSAGPILTSLINIDNQLFGSGDPTNPQFLWYSGQGQHFGDFSFNPQGGGYVGIDYGGTTTPTTPFPFHDGKGNPAPSVLTHGAAGRGKLYHIQFTTTTVGTTSLTYPNVYEASAQDGCPSPRGVAVYNQNAYYCTGTAFKTTGTKPNIINILATDTISNQILPDIQRLNLQALPNYVSEEFLGKIYFALPSGNSQTNNEIWVLDLTRGGLWILPWGLADGSSVQHIWTYEDNTGNSHLFILTTQNQVLELDLLRRSTPTQDNGTAFSTLLRSGAMVFDTGGVAEVASYFTYLKFLYPQGVMNANIYGLTEDNVNGVLVTGQLNEQAISQRLVWGQLLYSNPDGSSVFSGDTGRGTNQPGPITHSADASVTLPLEVDDIVSEQTWEITTEGIGCDYLLSSVTTTVYTIPRRYAGST